MIVMVVWRQSYRIMRGVHLRGRSQHLSSQDHNLRFKPFLKDKKHEKETVFTRSNKLDVGLISNNNSQNSACLWFSICVAVALGKGLPTMSCFFQMGEGHVSDILILKGSEGVFSIDFVGGCDGVDGFYQIHCHCHFSF